MGKKLFWIIAASAMLAPCASWAQDSDGAQTQAQDSESAGAETAAAGRESHPMGRPVLAQAQTDNAEAAPAQTQTEAAPAAEAAPAQTVPAAAESHDAGKNADIVMSQTVEDQKADRESRKEAMRNLSKQYPADAAAPAPAAGAGETSAAAGASEPVRARVIPAAQKTSERMPHFEHHGYFRTRLTAFGNYDLNTRGTSPVPAPLDSEQRGNATQDNIDAKDSDALLGGNLRFRYSPTIHISETVRVTGTFDILDNLVMGTTPNGLRAN